MPSGGRERGALYAAKCAPAAHSVSGWGLILGFSSHCFRFADNAEKARGEDKSERRTLDDQLRLLARKQQAVAAFWGV